MYKYPTNLREKAKLGLWTLTDIVIIATLTVTSILFLVKGGILFPLVISAIYLIMSANIEGVSIKDYLNYIFKFCITSNQYFEWSLE